MTPPLSRAARAAVTGAARTRPEGLDVDRVAQATAAARRTPATAQALAGTTPDEPPDDDPGDEVTDAELTVALERAADADKAGTNPIDAILAGVDPPPTDT